MVQTGSDKKFQHDIELVKQALAALSHVETETLAVQNPLAIARQELENMLRVLTVYTEHPEMGVLYQKGQPGVVRVIGSRRMKGDENGGESA